MEHEAEFIKKVRSATELQQESEAKALKKRLSREQKRINELNTLIKKIYEDNVNGKLSDKRFEMLLADYEANKSTGDRIQQIDIYLKYVGKLDVPMQELTPEQIKEEELESCGFIHKYNAFGMKKKNAVYQLMDCFTLFYFKFLKSEPTDEHFWTNQINTPAVNTWLGLAFERVCMEHVDQIKMKLGISGVLTEVNSWYCKSDPDHGVFGSQIDMLIARKDQVINLCEMKYSQSEYTITEKMDRSIRNKISDLITVSGTVYICSSSSNYCSRAGRSINIRISSLGRRTSYVSTGGSDVNIFVFYL